MTMKKRSPVRPCLMCETLTKNPKFCSVKCQQALAWENNKKRIAAGEQLSIILTKRYLIETHGQHCEVCKRTEWEGQSMPVVMDHIDGDPNNNNLENLRLICPNCDYQTPTFAGRNRGKNKGREYRREMYRKKVEEGQRETRIHRVYH